jgi:hypothetical protein
MSAMARRHESATGVAGPDAVFLGDRIGQELPRHLLGGFGVHVAGQEEQPGRPYARNRFDAELANVGEHAVCVGVAEVGFRPDLDAVDHRCGSVPGSS